MWYRIVKVLVFALALAAAMQAIRLLLVEPADVASACVINAQQWHCKLRMLAINGFARHLYGPISLGAALLAWMGAIRLFAVLAMIAGMAGAVLYDFNLSALGMMLGALLLVRDNRTSAAQMVEQQS
jgi:hypothetical protein